MPTEVFNRSDDGVQFSATVLFNLRRRNCSTCAAEVFNLVRYIQPIEKISLEKEKNAWAMPFGIVQAFCLKIEFVSNSV